MIRTAADFPNMTATARAIARDFLQSVVVVDDRAAFGGEDTTRVLFGTALRGAAPADKAEVAYPEAAAVSRARRRLPRLQLPQGELAGPGPFPEQALDAKVLVDGFADQGLVCAVIRPDSTESPVERTVCAARRADIVILDWELNGDGGESTLEIVHRLVHEEAEAEPRGRLRLVAIYSGALALRKISSRLRKQLSGEKTASSRFRRDGEFAITAGAVRIVVFAKSTTRLEMADGELRARVIEVRDLPTCLIDEFAKMTIGLVPHVTLASLSALRKNMHRVLGRLRADLDPAYLWHRATQGRPADAEAHLVNLVADELRAVLEDEDVGKWANLDAISQWLEHSNRSDFGDAFGEEKSRSVEDILILLTKGAAGKGDDNKEVREKFSKMCVEKGAHRHDRIAGFAETAGVAKSANENLAALMSLKTRYERPLPRLELGSILTRGRGKSRTYWLCVQPRCDSVRLKGCTAFPLLPLRPVDDGKKFDVLLPKGREGYQRFLLVKRPAEIEMPVFPVCPADSDSVVAEVYGKNFAFITQGGRRYTWVADLKSDHAQRIAQQVANEFSRVGLTESEWLRLWTTKG